MDSEDISPGDGSVLARARSGCGDAGPRTDSAAGAGMRPCFLLTDSASEGEGGMVTVLRLLETLGSTLGSSSVFRFFETDGVEAVDSLLVLRE